MDHLTNFETFLGVLEHGSFAAWGRRKGISQPAVSQQIAALEAHYGKTLVNRGPGGATATRAGQILAHHAHSVLEQHRMLSTELAALEQETAGEFRISMSQFLAQSRVGHDVQALCNDNLDLRLILRAEDRMVDVVREGYDLALRTGGVGTGDGVVRKLGEIESHLVGAPGLLDRLGRPDTPEGLSALPYIRYNEERSQNEIPLTRDGTPFRVKMREGMIVDTPLLFQSAALRGFGVARMPAIACGADVASGALERVLPDYQLTPKSVYIVYPHREAFTQTAKLVVNTICKALAGFDHITLTPEFRPTKAA